MNFNPDDHDDVEVDEPHVETIAIDSVEVKVETFETTDPPGTVVVIAPATTIDCERCGEAQ